jgi:hypothetical protein
MGTFGRERCFFTLLPFDLMDLLDALRIFRCHFASKSYKKEAYKREGVKRKRSCLPQQFHQHLLRTQVLEYNTVGDCRLFEFITDKQ